MRLAPLVLALAGVAFAGSAFAATSITSTFQVAAKVDPVCTISGSTTLQFNTYDPVTANASTNLDGTGTMSVKCTKKAVVRVALNNGANGVGTCAAPNRRMSANAGADFLNYAIFSDTTRANAWGCTANTNDFGFTSASSTADTVLTAYGRVPSGQDAATGTYADTVTFTVTF